jgi:predicted metal-binding membrane protein
VQHLHVRQASGIQVVSGDRRPLAALAVVTVCAWAVLLFAASGMQMDVVTFLAAWTLMMTAMMLPSAAPLVVVHARAGRGTGFLATGYLLVWAATGAAAYGATRLVDPMMVSNAVKGSVLVAAGVYQLTPLEHLCLKRCRSPLDFLMQRWRPGRLGALRLGVDHGLFCVGCCWALMAVLVLAVAMSPAWAAAIAAAVFAEKVLPRGEAIARVLAVALLAFGLVTAFG